MLNNLTVTRERYACAGVRRRVCTWIVLCATAAPALFAQTAPPAAMTLDSLIARAVAVSPLLRAASHRVDAARARIGPAGALPDPMLMAGIQNLPLGQEREAAGSHTMSTSGPDPMTMRMLGVSQTIPYPGKRALRERIAQREVVAALTTVASARLDVERRVREAYYELAYIDQALSIAERHRAVLADIQRVAAARYESGAGSQPDALRPGVDLARLADDMNALVEQRRAHLAALNALLDRPSDAPIPLAIIPLRIARAAVSDSAARIRFTATDATARVADSPLPPLDALQVIAASSNPMLKEHEAQIAVQAARVTAIDKDRLPDFDLGLQYGQRPGRPDMVTATVSIPLPIQRARKQDQDVAQARAALAALEAEHHAQLLALRGEVAQTYTELERARTQLALYVKAIIPQGRTVLTASLAEFQTGKGDLRAVLENQATLFDYETTYYRTLTDFAKRLAALDQIVGKEILP